MLFSLVYTWIKYKMSPPSVVALNRLFVERDSKHRRITSNLGLTFRNSKWSGYARNNINLDAKTDFLWSIIRASMFLVAVAALFTGLGYYNNSLTVNPFILLYWFAMDSNLYFQITTISGTFYLIQLLIDTLHHKITTALFSPLSNPTQSTNNNPTTLQIPKRLHKPLLYSLVRQSTSSDMLEKLLNTNSIPQTGLIDLNFLRSLYRTTHLIKLLLNPTPVVRLVDALSKPSSSSVTDLPKFLNNVAKLRKPSLDTIALDYALFKGKSLVTPLRACSSPRWDLAHVAPSAILGLPSTTTLHGLFYFPSTDQTTLHSLTGLYPELSYLNSSLEEQTRVIRWDRWLYKYSLLHRSSLKTGFYLNLFKSSLGSGFYNQDTGTRNLWLPSSLNTTSDNFSSSYPSALYDQVYGRSLASDLLRSLPSSLHFYNKSNLAPFSFYESSYYWALRRFYRLNSSNSNQLSSKPLLRTSSWGTLATYNMYTGSAMGYNLNLTRDLSSLVNYSTLSTTPCSNSSTQLRNLNTTSDPYLAYSTQLFFSKERLEMLHNVVSNRSSKIAIQNNQEPLDCRLRLNYDSLFKRK